MTAPVEDEKIYVEFSLTDDGRRKLEAFFATNMEALRASDRTAKDALKALIQTTFPPDALERITLSLRGQSNTAWVIHNLPETKGLEQRNGYVAPEEMISCHIGTALYETYQAESKNRISLTRHRFSEAADVKGTDPHRDHTGRVIIFSAPHNPTHAPTEIIRMRAAIESIPQSMREQIRVSIEEETNPPTPECSLEEVWQKLQTEKLWENGVKVIRLVSPAESTEGKAFTEAVKNQSRKIDLQPGDMLFIDQHQFFHQAHVGDLTLLAGVPAEVPLQRVFLHHAANPLQR